MNNNLYWSVYKNLERELTELADLIHFDDGQLKVYSIKISELLLRTVVEIESVVKELYFLNGGTKTDDKDLYFDTDCIELIETKWKLSKKQVLVSAYNFYFLNDENKILTPLYKANKRGSSSSDWQKAYQSVKHNRAKNLTSGNLKNLIRSMAGLYILNIYYKETLYDLEKDASATNFDNSLGSTIFSIKIHVNNSINTNSDYEKNSDFDECVYILKPTDETRNEVQNAIKNMNRMVDERTNATLVNEISKQISGLQITHEEAQERIKNIAAKIKNDSIGQVVQEIGHTIKKTFEDLRYEAVLNKQQY